LYVSNNSYITVNEFRRMSWAGHSARMERREINTEFRGGETRGKETARNNIKANFKSDRVAYTGFIWLRIGTGGGLF